MRRVAGELGVAPMTLCYHVPDRAAGGHCPLEWAV